MTVIFVCTGNTCRSPIAEALARKKASDRGLTGVTFASAGIGAAEGTAANDASILVGIERGLDLGRHRTRQFTAELVDDDSIVLAMSQSHLHAIREVAPDARAYLLDEYASYGERHGSVADPFGGTLEDYRATTDEIDALLDDVLDRLASEEGAQK